MSKVFILQTNALSEEGLTVSKTFFQVLPNGLVEVYDTLCDGSGETNRMSKMDARQYWRDLQRAGWKRIQ